MGNKQTTTEIVGDRNKPIKGLVVLKKKNLNRLLNITDVGGSILDGVDELLGKNISIQLISAVHPDHRAGSIGILPNRNITSLKVEELCYEVSFNWNEEIGIPGAFLIKNNHHNEFYLKTFTLEAVPGHGNVHFVCNSWVYPTKYYSTDRVFFTNKAYLPAETPSPLVPYRKEELKILKGNGTGMLREWDRVYDYAFYNDLGYPNNPRPTLGGNPEFPYPRRGRTGRPPNKNENGCLLFLKKLLMFPSPSVEANETESRLPLIKSLDIYVPRDEQFGYLKLSDTIGYGLKSIVQFVVNESEHLFDGIPLEFDSFEEVSKIYNGGIKLREGILEKLGNKLSLEVLKAIAQTNGEGLAKFPKPQVISKDEKYAWRNDREFAREMLAGVNPVCIRLLKEFPPKSKLDFELYGNQNSSIEASHIETNLDGLEIDEALESNRLFTLDHHDSLMPYVNRINGTHEEPTKKDENHTKIYAARTLLFLQKDGTLKPLAIELSLPNPKDERLGAVSKVYTPAEQGVEGSIWELAKAYVAVNDSGVHQLISHWLNTHCVIEPFVIATNRNLSILHPIHKLLKPHFRDTMSINALARQILINAGGLLEGTVFPGKYAMELSSKIYKDWVFTDQALPIDLIKRGMAIEDSSSPTGIRLLIEDYPYAVDGLEIWFAIKTWVREYCSFYYKTDGMVQDDEELKEWWKELRENGHGDKKDEPWWPIMDSCHNLIDICTTIIWVASALHAAVNFGQYSYAGYFPNRPTISRRFMPEPNTPEFDELEKNPDSVFLKTITAQRQALLGISLIELLSRHPLDEVYLGETDSPNWTLDSEPLKAFEKFGKEMREIEGRIEKRNTEYWNRVGDVEVPYTLLQPFSKEGLTGRGIPNSVTI